MLKNRITNQLQKQGKNQAWLVDMTGISKGMISQIASGRSLPTAKELSIICGVLGCKREDLYNDDLLVMITGKQPGEDGTRKQKPTVRMTDVLVNDIDTYRLERGCNSRDETARVLISLGLFAARLPNFEEYQRWCKQCGSSKS